MQKQTGSLITDENYNREVARIPPHYTKLIREMISLCTDVTKHEYGPDGYLSWHEWAEEKGKTHRQLKCKCGFYLIWVPKLLRAVK